MWISVSTSKTTQQQPETVSGFGFATWSQGLFEEQPFSEKSSKNDLRDLDPQASCFQGVETVEMVLKTRQTTWELNQER